jgi:DNA-binding transcriptional LysR family regulator
LEYINWEAHFNSANIWMDTDSLQAFIAVARAASFSQAAQQLHLTQPAVSKRIATLEKSLGSRLFDRLGRQIVLTEAGQTLLPRAQQIIQELGDCRQALLNLSGQVSGRLVIATSHHIGLHRLPPLLRAYVENFPQVQLDLRFTDSELGCEMVENSAAELGIITLPLQPSKELTCKAIWNDPLIVIANHDHPLAGSAPVHPKQLAQHPAILPGEITFTRRLVDEFFKRHNVELQVAFATNYLETIKTMVNVGLGWSVLPATMCGNGLVRLAVSDFQIQRTLGTVQHNGRTLSNAAQSLLDLIAQHPS